MGGSGALLTTAEAARLLHCSDRHVRRLIDAEVLAASDIRVPGSPRPAWRVRRESIEDLLLLRENGSGLDGQTINQGPIEWAVSVEEMQDD